MISDTDTSVETDEDASAETGEDASAETSEDASAETSEDASAETGEDAAKVDLQKEMDAFIEGAAGLFGNLKEIFLKSKDEVARGAQIGKVRIDVFQLRKDREHFLQRLGEEAYDLMQQDEIAHADLDKAFGKVKSIDDRIEAVEAEIEVLVEEHEAAREAAAAEAEAAASAAEAEASSEASSEDAAKAAENS